VSAGVKKAPPRCGCCDRPNPFAVCSRCDEPMCPDHFVRLMDAQGERQYVCTICAEIQLGAYLTKCAASAPTSEVAVA
jgi:hypothetical protein